MFSKNLDFKHAVIDLGLDPHNYAITYHLTHKEVKDIGLIRSVSPLGMGFDSIGWRTELA